MKLKDIASYYSYRLVQMMNDKIGQIVISVHLSVLLLGLRLFNILKGSVVESSSSSLSIIQIVTFILVAVSMIFVRNLKLIVTLDDENRKRVLRVIRLSCILAIVDCTLSSSIYAIYDSIVANILYYLLASFILASDLTKSESMYLSKDQ